MATARQNITTGLPTPGVMERRGIGRAKILLAAVSASTVAAMGDSLVEPGIILLGKYRIERLLGEGGMGVVALARHMQLDQPVAIKFLLQHMLRNRDVVERFKREARAAVKLRSEHVCVVYDVGELDSGAPYMVMEYLHGTDLSQLLKQHGPMAVNAAVELMLQACEALAEAHALGIVHRDIKPGNFFLTKRSDGTPLLKVLDFGISKTADNAGTDLTATNAMMGTPAYMSPEQARSSKSVDHRADVWAMGIVLYELITGRRPFVADTSMELCIKIISDPHGEIEIPGYPGLAEVIKHCLIKEPDHRLQNMAELARALAPYAHSQTQAVTTVDRTARLLGLTPQPRPSTDHGYGQGQRGHGQGPGQAQGQKGEPGSVPPISPTTLGASTGQRIGAAPVGAVDSATPKPRSRRVWAIAGSAVAALAIGAAVITMSVSGGPGNTALPAAASGGAMDAAAGQEQGLAADVGSGADVGDEAKRAITAQGQAALADAGVAAIGAGEQQALVGAGSDKDQEPALDKDSDKGAGSASSDTSAAAATAGAGTQAAAKTTSERSTRKSSSKPKPTQAKPGSQEPANSTRRPAPEPDDDIFGGRH